ncbi:MAG TPA: flagellar hook-basal body complex protein FliE [Steroidobacteraceae bacterium]|jgi:flagellar hook-basal body complex protein FliE|nr:flagellar hook-basal body complex protein FliE [Steroidobacteraceae bacterium]
MSIESIAALAANALPAAPTQLATVAPAVSTPGAHGAFQTILSGINELNDQLQGAERSLQKLALGEGLDNLHQTMMGMERTRLSLQLLLQVRSRALEAYQELMRMQI